MEKENQIKLRIFEITGIISIILGGLLTFFLIGILLMWSPVSPNLLQNFNQKLLLFLILCYFALFIAGGIVLLKHKSIGWLIIGLAIAIGAIFFIF